MISPLPLSPSDHWCELLSTLQINSAPQILIPLKPDLRHVRRSSLLLILALNWVEYYVCKDNFAVQTGSCDTTISDQLKSKWSENWVKTKWTGTNGCPSVHIRDPNKGGNI